MQCAPSPPAVAVTAAAVEGNNNNNNNNNNHNEERKRKKNNGEMERKTIGCFGFTTHLFRRFIIAVLAVETLVVVFAATAAAASTEMLKPTAVI